MTVTVIKDQEIIDFYWHLHLSGKSLFTNDLRYGVSYVFQLNEADFITFPELEGGENIILSENNGRVRCVLESFE